MNVTEGCPELQLENVPSVVGGGQGPRRSPRGALKTPQSEKYSSECFEIVSSMGITNVHNPDKSIQTNNLAALWTLEVSHQHSELQRMSWSTHFLR